ncbi:MAG: GntR family transcriptional regulator [Mycobacteriales bacterium]
MPRESADITVTIDRASPVPLYFQVAECLTGAITDGTLAPGAKLANELDLADRFGVSRPTMRKAIEQLVDQGLLVRRRGVGTQVVHTQVRRSIELTSLHDDLAVAGQRPRTDVLGHAVEPALDDVARALGIRPGTPVVSLQRLRFARDEPLALMHNFLPVDLCDIDAARLTDHGLYALLRGAGITLSVAHQTIGARQASAAEAKLLAERRNAPLLTMVRTTYDDRGRAVEFASHLYRASLYQFDLTLRQR